MSRSHEDIFSDTIRFASNLGLGLGVVCSLDTIPYHTNTSASSLLRNLGSVGLALIYWVIGWLISLAGISTYLEFAAYFPSRSGGDVVYLEQAYPRPKFFFPIAFAVQTVVLSFVSSNVIVVSQYIFRMTDITPTDWQFKGVGVAALTIITLRELMLGDGW